MYFFFQAEDGIRDDLVTGVQTCALPICCRSDRVKMSSSKSSVAASSHCKSSRKSASGCSGRAKMPMKRRKTRSEERRVGKEWRSRWARERVKRKGREEGRDGSTR